MLESMCFGEFGSCVARRYLEWNAALAAHSCRSGHRVLEGRAALAGRERAFTPGEGSPKTIQGAVLRAEIALSPGALYAAVDPSKWVRYRARYVW